MKVHSNSFENGERMPASIAFGKFDPDSHVALSDNRSPHLAWEGAPAGTKSFAVVMHDPDVPSVGDDVNKEGHEVAADLPRVNFYHWVLVDLPAGTGELAEGEFSTGITPHGKQGPGAPRGGRHGINDYTGWFAGDDDMKGDYYGYDGPCPPWNDQRLHRYVVTVYALDVDELPVEGRFTGADVLAAMKGHILAEASTSGLYAIYPDARAAW